MCRHELGLAHELWLLSSVGLGRHCSGTNLGSHLHIEPRPRKWFCRQLWECTSPRQFREAGGRAAEGRGTPPPPSAHQHLGQCSGFHAFLHRKGQAALLGSEQPNQPMPLPSNKHCLHPPQPQAPASQQHLLHQDLPQVYRQEAHP